MSASKGRYEMQASQAEHLHELHLRVPDSGRVSWRERRRALARADRDVAQRAVRVRLDTARVALAGAADIVADGWIQNAWFQVRDETETVHTVTAGNLDLLDRGRVLAACLVGAVVQAAGGPYAARDQVTGDSLDLVWHAAFGADRRVGPGLSPPPQVRSLRVRDLTRWNDRPGRCIGEVLDLLDAADDRAIVAAVDDRR
jgi:hypothetical protein